jgi:hypothetical protein
VGGAGEGEEEEKGKGKRRRGGRVGVVWREVR